MFKKMFSSIIVILILFSFISAVSAYSSTIYCPSYATFDYCYLDKLQYEGSDVDYLVYVDGDDMVFLHDKEFYSKFQFPSYEYYPWVCTKDGLWATTGKYNGKNYNTMTIHAPDNVSCGGTLRFEFADHRNEFTVTIPNLVANNTNSEYCLDHEFKVFKNDRVYLDSKFGYYGQGHVYDNYRDSILHKD